MNFGDTIDGGRNQGLVLGFVSAVIALSILGNWFQLLLLWVLGGPYIVGTWAKF